MFEFITIVDLIVGDVELFEEGELFDIDEGDDFIVAEVEDV